MVKIFLLSLLVVNAADKVKLTPDEAAHLAAKGTLRSKEVDQRYQSFALRPYEVLSAFDWKLTAETGFERDRAKALTTSGDPDYSRHRTTVNLGKSLLTGTLLSFEYAKIAQTNSATVPDTNLNSDTLGFSLEQSLWGNFFGVADRALISSAETEYQSTLLLRSNELEDLVLETLRLYWNTYVAQKSFNEAIQAKARYEKLVVAIRRKSSVGYASPGEFSQIQAEFETRNQNIQTTSLEYLQSLESLVTMLGLPPQTEIDFIVPQDLPPIPHPTPQSLEQRRALRAQKMKVDAAQDALKAAESRKYPNLNLVGRYAGSGLSDSGGVSQNDALTGKNPKYYVGIKLQYNFGSGIQEQTELNRRVTLDLEQTRLQRQGLEEKDRDQQIQRKVTSTYEVVQSTKVQRQHRDRAVQELTRTYNQGRTDISVLIDALNKYFAAEVQHVRAIADYHIALKEWAAARDELLP